MSDYYPLEVYPCTLKCYLIAWMITISLARQRLLVSGLVIRSSLYTVQELFCQALTQMQVFLDETYIAYS